MTQPILSCPVASLLCLHPVLSPAAQTPCPLTCCAYTLPPHLLRLRPALSPARACIPALPPAAPVPCPLTCCTCTLPSHLLRLRPALSPATHAACPLSCCACTLPSHPLRLHPALSPAAPATCPLTCRTCGLPCHLPRLTGPCKQARRARREMRLGTSVDTAQNAVHRRAAAGHGQAHLYGKNTVS